MSDADRITELEAIISDALAYEWRGDNFDQKHMREILSRVPQGAAEPWTDPEPWTWHEQITGRIVRASAQMIGSGFEPRSREQYDTEEADRG